MTMPDEQRLAQQRDRLNGWKAIGVMILGVGITIFLTFLAVWLLDAYRGPAEKYTKNPRVARESEVALTSDSLRGERVPPEISNVNMTLLDPYADRKKGLIPPADTVAKDTGYAWVDSAGGVVRLPIEKAMELVVRGVRPTTIAPPTGLTPTSSPTQAEGPPATPATPTRANTRRPTGGPE